MFSLIIKELISFDNNLEKNRLCSYIFKLNKTQMNIWEYYCLILKDS